MKCIIDGLPELVDENQALLGHLILGTMDLNNFKVDGVAIHFEKDGPDNTGTVAYYRTGPQ